MKIRKALVCPCCGANKFESIQHGSEILLRCEYCGTEYESSEEQKEKVKTPENLPNETVSGCDHIGLEYVVHNKLTITGCDNRIMIGAVSERATHVSVLSISGCDNVVRVKLMPGASKSITGCDNRIG